MLCRGETKLHRHLHTNMKQSPKYTVRLGHTQTHTTLSPLGKTHTHTH